MSLIKMCDVCGVKDDNDYDLFPDHISIKVNPREEGVIKGIIKCVLTPPDPVDTLWHICNNCMLKAAHEKYITETTPYEETALGKFAIAHGINFKEL